jgi:serine-type D-Ala-D-Ala endopeptidase (penicillin-binding protein 7)
MKKIIAIAVSLCLSSYAFATVNIKNKHHHHKHQSSALVKKEHVAHQTKKSKAMHSSAVKNKHKHKKVALNYEKTRNHHYASNQIHSNQKITHRNSYSRPRIASISDIVPPVIAGSSIAPSDITQDNEINAPQNMNVALVSRQPRFISGSALVIDAKTGEVLVSKNPNERRPIASISKLMTAMVVLDSGANLDDYVTISDADIDTLRNTYSRLKVGMQFRRRDLLLLALMSSENRAAHALARTTFPGGTAVFIEKMNQKAKSIGMMDTAFYDPTGLNENNQSTAADLSKMVQAAFNYPLIRKDTTTKNADVALGPRYVHQYINSDALVRADRFTIALSKTGFINESGHCLALYAFVQNHPVAMVFLDSPLKHGGQYDAVVARNFISNHMPDLQNVNYTQSE